VCCVRYDYHRYSIFKVQSSSLHRSAGVRRWTLLLIEEAVANFLQVLLFKGAPETKKAGILPAL
jgi:hypothetical protein